MREGIVYGRPVEMQGGPFALMAYRREFGTDMLSDLIEAYRGGADGADDVCAFLQAAWAMAKCADESTSPYPEWLREFDPRLFTLGDTAGAVGVIDSAIAAELFRGGAARGRLGRVAAGWLGAVAHRLRAGQARLLGRRRAPHDHGRRGGAHRRGL